MRAEAKSRETQTVLEGSEGVIRPTIPGNSGGGKDAEPTTRPNRASSALRGGEPVNSRLDRITVRARRHPQEKYDNLFHHLDTEMMTEAFAELKEGRAPGMDGVTKEEFATELQEHLQDLEGQLHRRACIRPLDRIFPVADIWAASSPKARDS